uniref:SFM domain-containing protein n=1 Tax=Macrostomum lignano TaxID=282301 RepID=A0A1I8FX68_9PLAT
MPVEDFRPELKHVEPEASNFKRLLELRKVERSEELESKINRPKPSVTDILRVERESDLKARLFRDPEVEQAELMYTNVQANLRGGHYAGMLESQQHGLPQQNQVPQHQQQLQQQPQQQHQQQPDAASAATADAASATADAASATADAASAATADSSSAADAAAATA